MRRVSVSRQPGKEAGAFDTPRVGAPAHPRRPPSPSRSGAPAQPSTAKFAQTRRIPLARRVFAQTRRLPGGQRQALVQLLGSVY